MNVSLIFVPLLLIEVALIVFAVADLLKSDRRVVGGNKVVWALVIVLVATVGPIAYLLAGRKSQPERNGTFGPLRRTS